MRLGFRKLSLPGIAMLLGAFALLASGCQIGGGSTSTGPSNLAKDQIFHYNYPNGGSADFATLDPDIVQDASSAEMIYLVHDGLVTFDRNLNIIPWAAKALPDISSDGLTYTFHLRDGLSFSNGTPLTAQDFAFSLNRSANPCVASPVANYVGTIKDAATFSAETCKNGVITAATGQTGPVIQSLIGDSITTPDSKTLVIQLAQAGVYFLAQMTYPTAYALDPAVVGSDITSEKWLDTLSQGATGQGTSGMFYVSTWDHAGGKLILKPNPHWWGRNAGHKPTLTEIDVTVFKDADTAYAAYQAGSQAYVPGQFDVGFPTAALLAQAKTQPDFHASNVLEFSGYVFNWTKPPFDNLDARIAACLAINRTQINTAISKGANIPAWNIVPKGMPGYNPNVTGPDGVTDPAGDTAKAQTHWQAYLTAAGSKAVKSWPYLFVSGSAAQRQTALALQGFWQQTLGVTVTLKGEDFNTFVADDTAGNYVATRFAWLDDYPDPQDFTSLLFHTGALYNSQKASIPQADALMDKADKDTNKTERISLYNQIEQLIVDNVGFCPGFLIGQYWQVRQYVHNWNKTTGSFVALPDWAQTYITTK